ncbi:NAD(P)-binding protein [Fistulina hepatica ATCC 64428]|uniref:NAD(P)-binding protein n=1 Tax=Fistulina hepatica ATCC 64428 TaxID=1128425 RepID=A0A0D7A839_9AGAR|nr:NAD(P)-binding protein [Fistulina hepatica ATCC 64428]
MSTSTSKPIAVVIGASRGIGEAFVHQFTRAGYHVVATMRTPAPIPDCPDAQILQLDMTSPLAAIVKIAEQVPEADVLVVSAALGPTKNPVHRILDTDDAELAMFLDVNTVGPHRCVLAFLPALYKRQTRKIALISSSSGSHAIIVGALKSDGPYCVSKSALNMLALQYHNELNQDGFTVVALNPGWTDTDLGQTAVGIFASTSRKMLSPETSTAGMVKILNELTPERSAQFLQWNGEIVPW